MQVMKQGKDTHGERYKTQLFETLTNEERRVATYTSSNIPTQPDMVSSKTPLSKLNLNWSEKELPQKARTRHVHGLHPYLGKFIPQIVEIFLRKYFSPGQTIYDPFCGSGTTLIQSNELNINSVGNDISAFNVLLSSVKTDHYDLEKASQEVFDILERVRETTQDKPIQPSLWGDNVSQESFSDTLDPYLLEWFAPQALKELLAYQNFIETGGYVYRNLLKVILSRSARSARLTTHFDLDFPKKPQTEPYWCYKHSRECYPVQEAFKFLKRYSTDTLSRIRQYARVQTQATVQIFNKDSRDIELPEIHGVITSPPYVGLIDYHEQHVYAYHLLRLEDKRDDEIGPAATGTSQRAKAQYQDDIAEVFKNTLTYMPKGGKLIVIAGDKHDLYHNIAVKAGVKVVDIVTRHVNRRTGRRSGEFYESVFIWEKPS